MNNSFYNTVQEFCRILTTVPTANPVDSLAETLLQAKTTTINVSPVHGADPHMYELQIELNYPSVTMVGRISWEGFVPAACKAHWHWITTGDKEWPASGEEVHARNAMGNDKGAQRILLPIARAWFELRNARAGFPGKLNMVF